MSRRDKGTNKLTDKGNVNDMKEIRNIFKMDTHTQNASASLYHTWPINLNVIFVLLLNQSMLIKNQIIDKQKLLHTSKS